MSTPNDLRVWTAEPLPDDVERALRRLARLDEVVAVAAMPDVHLARDVCVGAAVATASHLVPAAVGGDIGCGMAVVRFDASADVVAGRPVAARLLHMLSARIPTSQHPTRHASLPQALACRRLSCASLERKQHGIGRVQLGTLGRGNHFAELQRDPDGALWLMLHSGSRGIGQAIRDHHGGRGDGDARLAMLEAESAAGADYLADLEWALDYARESRRRMVEAAAEGVAEVVGARAVWNTYVDCHHNFVRREIHDGRPLWVHRKGAISARAGEPGVIPGSMGSPSFHVTGRGNAASLCSSSHGAGRIMSRTEARRRVSAAVLHERMRGVWFDHRLIDRLRDEAPQAYKDIGAVMRAQRELTRAVRRLEPVLVYKGG